MVITNQQGWVAIKFTILLLLLTACISYTLTFQLQLNQEMSTDKICRTEQQKIMSQARDGIKFIFAMNPMAESLYNLQKALEPFTWNPKVAALYAKILALRKKFESIQTIAINAINLSLKIQALHLYSKLSKNFSNLTSSYREYYNLHTYMLPPKNLKLAIIKKQLIIFPPYKIESNFSKKQELKIDMFSLNKSESKSFIETSYSQSKACSASLKEKGSNQFEIIYNKKANFIPSW